ncbi:hypothetical protein [Persicobacter diffluens]|uniref:Uncharacterized protein n=1 Tax=Persicobacter diffluens TaxID=981 RepID=A0AAN4W3R9_9BACT|nr:hypothetical protein PEDI_45570 [Persicobacter diffluens]
MVDTLLFYFRQYRKAIMIPSLLFIIAGQCWLNVTTYQTAYLKAFLFSGFNLLMLAITSFMWVSGYHYFKAPSSIKKKFPNLSPGTDSQYEHDQYLLFFCIYGCLITVLALAGITGR